MNWNYLSSFLHSITWSPGEGGQNNKYNREGLLDLEGRIKLDVMGGRPSELSKESPRLTGN